MAFTSDKPVQTNGKSVPWRRYFWEPVFLAATALYALNRFWLKAHFGQALPFLHDHFNDLLLIPVALPLLLWIFRCCGLRHHDGPPSLSEVVEWTLIWSILFEWALPKFLHLGTADFWDAFCYAVGGGVAVILWRRKV